MKNKENKFINDEKNMIIKILPKNKENKENEKNKENKENNINKYSHIRTISALSRFCYGIAKKRKLFRQKYEKDKIKDDDIINTVFEIIFRDDNEKV